MGSTVFVQAQILSFPTSGGRVGYVWSEETYEKKEGPKHANWCVMAIGYREQMVERIFGLAHSIPGGMLHVKNSSARSFITAMLEQLDRPLGMTTTKLLMSNSSDGFYSPIRDANRIRIQGLLNQAGKTAEAQSIAAAPAQGGANLIELNLQTDLDLVLEILKRHDGSSGGRSMNVAPWQILHHQFMGRGAAPGPVEPVTALPFRGDVDLTLMETGLTDFGKLRYFCVEGLQGQIASDYMIEQALIDHAGRMEGTQPGYYKALLGQLRKQEKQLLPVLPDDTVFEIDATQAPSYLTREVAEVSKSIIGRESLAFSVTLEEIKQAVEAALAPQNQETGPWQRNRIFSLIQNQIIVRVNAPAAEEQDEQRAVERMQA